MGPHPPRKVPPAVIAEAEIRAELGRVLASSEFATQDRLQKFLTYIVEQTLAGHGDDLKERTIGSEALGRRIDYDPKIDPIVRVQARRLRDKLDDYYQANASALRIHLPKGGYVPEFVSAPQTAEPLIPPAEPPGEPASPPSPSSGRRMYFVLGAAAALCIFVLVAAYRHSPTHAAARVRPFLSALGTYDHPAFSPDGHSIAYDWDGPNYDNTDVYVQAVDSDTPIRLTSDPAEEARPAWSPDGKQIAFVRRIASDRVVIMRVAAAGGATQSIGQITAVGHTPRIDWSPRGDTIITSEPAEPTGGPERLVLISVSSGSARALTLPALGYTGDSEAVFSPDGSTVAFLRSKASAVQDIFLVSASGGGARQITNDNALISGLCWTPDSHNILFTSTRDGGGYALWSVPVVGGQPVRLTATPPAAAFPTVAPQTRRVAFSVKLQDENIWRANLKSPEPPASIIDSGATDSTPALSPDGTLLAFRSSRTGASEIWICSANGASPRRLTHSGGAQAGSPDWSPDGQSIAYTATLNGPPHVYIISRDGGSPRRLTAEDATETMPHWSRDGRSIYYGSNISGADEIWKTPVHGGPAIQITHDGGMAGEESFDGRTLFFTKGEKKSGLWRLALDGGKEEEVAPQLSARTWGNWRVARDGVYFLNFVWRKPFVEELYFFDTSTNRVRLVTRMPGIAAPFAAGLAISPDDQFAYFVQVDHWGVGLYFAEDVAW